MDNSVVLWGIVIILLISLSESHGGYSKNMEPTAQLSSNVHFHSRRGRCFFGGGEFNEGSTGNHNSDFGSPPETQITVYRNRPVRTSVSNAQPNYLHQFRSLSGSSSQLSSDTTYKFYPYAVAVPYPSN